MPHLDTDPQNQPPKQPSRWLILAISSGAFAALNGLFAKLTTDTNTTTLATTILQFFGAHEHHPLMVLVIRGICLALNVLCNIIMWALFTRALTASPSTTKVSITNTAANFLVTAVLGMGVFGERVDGLWWVGAGMMGAGCVIVGLRDQ
ncbi:hypothetical protein BO94DRAFT_621537 [Aspergillus sclerotioniger CBS 115572]|uniref:EamA domain-containing protein n=1 Tax=Aspergillus sclerotioniger CBS 115572 TaxID=1450535 RepID=A0A317X662_9EURO|nr:hypothetical protein BO94DRAFT_621537 [Aspergillus sclerotioniger CBS 115572]PWY94084.1 hypothetical protein BO94DRAFT_621537 [Aspergillus sclerotioniger CBS 115572]